MTAAPKTTYVSAMSQTKFTKYEDVRRVLHAQTETALIEGLTALRNHLTVKHSEAAISPSDERLLLAKVWLESDGSAQALIDIWERTATRQVGLTSLIVSILSCLITLLSSHYMYTHLATPLIRNVLSPKWSTKLNSYLSTTHNELLLVTLKLYNSMSAFAGGKEARLVFESFPWELKSLSKLTNMRRRTRANDKGDTLHKPDIRTLYILFLLSFVDSRTPTAVKAMFLEQRRDHLVSAFKGLGQDSYFIMRRVLETCWSGIWLDVKIKRTLKVQIFSETVIGQILRLYERDAAEEDDTESIPADVAHHFLLAICTRPGIGVCFKDHGWYPREDEHEEGVEEASDEASRRQQGRIFNKILANVLKLLRINEDSRQQELALRILGACPELVAGFWHTATLTLEPRLSSKWIANIAFFGSLISLPVPHSSFVLSDDPKLFRPTPPPLTTIMENIFPSVNIKSHLSRGLQSQSTLVQHCTALALAKCFNKYGAVITAMRDVQKALEEEDEDGLWSIRRKEVEREVCRRVPEFQVIVAFVQQKSNAMPANGEVPHVQDLAMVTKAALLSESAQRLLWLYHRYMPQIVSEARFDVAKLLSTIQEGVSTNNSTSGLITLRQLHTLRLLNESEGFALMNKTGSSRGNLSILLALCTATGTSAIRRAAAALLKRSLTQTLLFQHDEHEVDLWLESISTRRRAPDACAPDGTPLTDEAAALVLFMDDCVQRCLKTPYRYLEELQSLWSQGSLPNQYIGMQESSSLPSPLLMAVIEQLEVKCTRALLSPSDCLAVVTYLRRVILRLAAKVQTLQPLYDLAKRLEVLVPSSIMVGISREMNALLTSLTQWERPSVTVDCTNHAADTFLQEISAREIPDSFQAKCVAVSALVDWFRLLDEPLDRTQFAALASRVLHFDAEATKDLLDHAVPGGGHLFYCISISRDFLALMHFSTLFIHCGNEDMDREETRRILIESAFATNTSGENLKQAIGTINHRLKAHNDEVIRKNLLLLIVELLEKAVKNRVPQCSELVSFVWHLPAIVSYASSSLHPIIRPVFALLIKYSTLTKEDNGHPYDDYVDLWTTALRSELSTLCSDDIETAVIWLHAMGFNRLLNLLDSVSTTVDVVDSHENLVLEGIASALSNKMNEDIDIAALTDRLPQLRKLASILPNAIAAKHILSVAIRASLPLFHDGILLPEDNIKNLSRAVTIARSQWSRGIKRSAEQVHIGVTFEGDEKTLYDLEIISAAIYTSRSAQGAVRLWILSSGVLALPIEKTARILYAYLDASLDVAGVTDQDQTVLAAYYVRVFSAVSDVFISEAARYLCTRLVSLISRLPPSLVESILACWDTKQEPSVDLLSCLANLPDNISGNTRDGVGRITQHALRWITARLSSSDELTPQSHNVLASVSRVVKRCKCIDSLSAETWVMTAVQYRLQDPIVLSAVNDVLGSVTLKPATVNRILQSILQHPKFQIVGRTSEVRQPIARSKLVAILHSLFHMHPTNTCQPSHVEPLLSLYGGTTSEADRSLLLVFKLFERTRKMSITSLLIRWSSTLDVPSATALEAIQGLDGTRVLRTCLQFPHHVSVSNLTVMPSSGSEDIYDTTFIVLLFGRMLYEGLPTTAPSWVQMFRTNVVSLLIRTLSAHDADVRDVALTQLTALHSALRDADFQEKLHVLHILDLLRDSIIRTPTDEHSPRLPVYTTLHLVHALRGVFYPSNFTYPLTARFLLQRPELDTGDMPLLYSMLYSISDQWRKERVWIVRFMSDGMVGRREWSILRKRHAWNLLASMFHSEDSDLHLRRSILELLANLTCERHAVSSLVLGGGLLSWIELQLEKVKLDEGQAWVKILENVLVVLDTPKSEASTGGEWRIVMCRCLTALLRSPACSLTVFAYTVRILLHASTLPTGWPVELDRLISLAVKHLSTIEDALQVRPPAMSSVPQTGLTLVSAPHRANTLWKPAEADELELWGQCVEVLWGAAMRMDGKCTEWDALTARMLVWRAWAGQRTEAGEWCRREVVRHMVVDEQQSPSSLAR